MKIFERWLVDDWRLGFKWATTWCCLGGITFWSIAAALVKGITIAVAFLGFVPLIWLPLIAVALSALTLVARFSAPLPKKEDNNDLFGC